VTKTPPETVEVPDAVRTNMRYMMLLLVVSIVAYVFSVPVVFLALITGPAAVVFGVLALVGTRGHRNMTGVRVSVSFGFVLAGISMMAALGSLLLYDLILEQRECEARALTPIAQRACDAAWEEGYAELLERYGVDVPE
jgi:hypothetical protein